MFCRASYHFLRLFSPLLSFANFPLSFVRCLLLDVRTKCRAIFSDNFASDNFCPYSRYCVSNIRSEKVIMGYYISLCSSLTSASLVTSPALRAYAQCEKNNAMKNPVRASNSPLLADITRCYFVEWTSCLFLFFFKYLSRLSYRSLRRGGQVRRERGKRALENRVPRAHSRRLIAKGVLTMKNCGIASAVFPRVESPSANANTNERLALVYY